MDAMEEGLGVCMGHAFADVIAHTLCYQHKSFLEALCHFAFEEVIAGV